MKRRIGLILILAIVCGTIGFAESIDLSTYDDDALRDLYVQVQEEMERRNPPTSKPEPQEEPVLMQKGSRGEDVRQLQEKLIDLGYLTGSADGDFGNKTLNAIIALQGANGLTEDGNVTQSLLDLIDEQLASMPEKPKSFTAKELYNKFDQNAIAAEEELNGKTITVTGKVYSIDTSMWGDVYVKLYADSWGFSGVYCYFNSDDKSEVAKLSKEQKVTIQGTCNGSGVFGDPQLNECKVVG